MRQGRSGGGGGREEEVRGRRWSMGGRGSGEGLEEGGIKRER